MRDIGFWQQLGMVTFSFGCGIGVAIVCLVSPFGGAPPGPMVGVMIAASMSAWSFVSAHARVNAANASIEELARRVEKLEQPATK